MNPSGSSSRGKKNKAAEKRWNQVAMSIYDLTVIANEGDRVDANNWEDADDEDREQAFALADALIRLVDNLIVPAVEKGAKKVQ